MRGDKGLNYYDKKLETIFYNGIFRDNKIYMQSSIYKLWACIDRVSGKMELIKNIDDCDVTPGYELRYVTQDADTIYAIDANCQCITEYDLKDNKCKYYSWNRTGYEKYYVAKWKEYLYIYPLLENEIICFNMCNKQVEIREREKQIADLEFSCACQVNDNIFFFGQNEAIKVDCTGEKSDSYRLPVQMSRCIDAFYMNDCIYVLDDYGMILKWHLQNDDMTIIREKGNQSMEFGRLICTENNIWLLPNCGEHIVKMDKGNRKDEIIVLCPDDMFYAAPSNWNKYGEKIETDKEYIIPCHSSQYIFIIPKNGENEKWLKVIAPSNIEMMSALLQYNPFLVEKTNGISLTKFVELLGRMSEIAN